MFKRKVFLAAFALGVFGWGGRGWDALGFARSNELHQSRIWEAEIMVLHKHWCQQNGGGKRVQCTLRVGMKTQRRSCLRVNIYIKYHKYPTILIIE